MCKANVTLTHEILHLGTHSGSEHALTKPAKAPHRPMWLKRAKDINYFLRVLSGGEARSAENQVPLNNQRMTKLEERAHDWIALMNLARPTL